MKTVEAIKQLRAVKAIKEFDNDTIKAIDLAIECIKNTAICDRCHKVKAVEFSTSTDMCYCKRCYKAVTDPRTPF